MSDVHASQALHWARQTYESNATFAEEASALAQAEQLARIADALESIAATLGATPPEVLTR